MSLPRQAPGREVARLCGPNLHPNSAPSEPGSAFQKHYSQPMGILPCLRMSSVTSGHLCCQPWLLGPSQHVPPQHPDPRAPPTGLLTLEPHSLGGSVRLGGVLRGGVVRGAAGCLEGHGAECTFVENLAVSLLDVAFQQGQGQVDDPTVDAPG